MARTTFRSFTKNLDVTDLRWMPGEGFSPSRLRIELLSGLTVALALVPEAVAFAFVAGVNPLVGLYAAFLVGLITALIASGDDLWRDRGLGRGDGGLGCAARC